ncbi:MAG: hypothetical protein HUU60_02000 [Armatimonadetes bacterium]|nr:hypothetical protein [Armatimonadota bacterium]
MRLLALGFLSVAFAFGQPKMPTVLVYQERAPLVQRQNQQPFDPNVTVQGFMTAELRELGKVEPVSYSTDHPTAQRIALDMRLEPSATGSPSLDLLREMAKQWPAQYLVVVTCERAETGQAIFARARLYQPTKREPVWQDEVMSTISVGLQSDPSAAAKSSIRTLAWRMNGDPFKDFAVTRQPVNTGGDAPPPSNFSPIERDPAKEGLDFLAAGNAIAAIEPLRAAITEKPYDLSLRLKLIEAYESAGSREAAVRESERALILFPGASQLTMKAAETSLSEGDRAGARERLLKAVEANPSALEPLLALCDLELHEANYDLAYHWAQKAVSIDAASALVSWRVYLTHGARADFSKVDAGYSHQPSELEFALFYVVVQGHITDAADELNDIRRVLSEPNPSLADSKAKLDALAAGLEGFETWLEAIKPEASHKESVGRIKLATNLLAQSSEALAHFLLSKDRQRLATAALLRTEALEELKAASP